jgi:ribosomal protein S18 acetylase RimI-like enzyme
VRIVRVGPDQAGLVADASALFDGPPRPEWTEAFLTEPGHHLLLAVDGDRPVGFVTGVELVHPDKGRELFVYELGTLEAHRRRGVAAALLRALAEIAVDRDCYGLWVSTEPDNEAALATYRAAGFTAEPAVVLERSLGAPGGEGGGG